MAAESNAVRAKARRSNRRSHEPVVRPAPEITVHASRTDVPAWLRHDLIQQAAYFRAEARGFEPGHDLEDWLQAEREVEALIRARYP